MKTLLMALLLTASFSLAGCGGGTCRSTCDDLAGYCHAEPSSCIKGCDEGQDVADKAGCSREYSDMIKCVSQGENVCEEDAAASTCSSEILAHHNCVES